MSYEIDFIPVGDGEKSGDAILLRYGNLLGSRNEQKVVLIDGGFTASREQVVRHLSDYYKTNTIDVVISTHPDSDHISGLNTVLEKCVVKQLLMHKPWEHAEEIKNLFKSERASYTGIEKSLKQASDLEQLALSKNIEIVEPFQGTNGLSMHILGPSIDFYRQLVPNFRSTPEPKSSILTPIKDVYKKAINWIEDHVGVDLLNDDEDTTSAENNSSVITLFEIDGQKILFTGDSGKTALLNAIEYANTFGVSLSDLSFFDVPHHGSKRNISSKILSSIGSKTAFISAAKESDKHPAKKVTNGLKKKEMKVFVNRGMTLRHHHNAPARPGWTAATEEAFHNKVEE